MELTKLWVDLQQVLYCFDHHTYIHHIITLILFSYPTSTPASSNSPPISSTHVILSYLHPCSNIQHNFQLYLHTTLAHVPLAFLALVSSLLLYTDPIALADASEQASKAVTFSMLYSHLLQALLSYLISFSLSSFIIFIPLLTLPSARSSLLLDPIEYDLEDISLDFDEETKPRNTLNYLPPPYSSSSSDGASSSSSSNHTKKKEKKDKEEVADKKGKMAAKVTCKICDDGMSSISYQHL